jgi:hypothetical protein
MNRTDKRSIAAMYGNAAILRLLKKGNVVQKCDAAVMLSRHSEKRMTADKRFDDRFLRRERGIHPYIFIYLFCATREGTIKQVNRLVIHN